MIGLGRVTGRYVLLSVVAFAVLGVLVAIEFDNWALGAMLPFLGIVIGLWVKELVGPP